jgi:preprotein translocase subunit YajC
VPVQPSWILAASTAKSNSGGSGFLLFVLFALVLFFLFRRSQGKARTRAAAAKTDIVVGSRVITTSGMYGTVVRVEDATYDLEVDTDVIITFAKAAVARLAPVDEDSADGEAAAAADHDHDHDGDHDHDHDGHDHDGHDHPHEHDDVPATVLLDKPRSDDPTRSSSET